MSISPKRSPCESRTTLFESHLLPGETLDQRSQRMEVAAGVCASCPLKTRSVCLKLATEAPAPRGVWGGKIFTKEGSVDV